MIPVDSIHWISRRDPWVAQVGFIENLWKNPTWIIQAFGRRPDLRLRFSATFARLTKSRIDSDVQRCGFHRAKGFSLKRPTAVAVGNGPLLKLSG
jgi:hypothetical protein